MSILKSFRERTGSVYLLILFLATAFGALVYSMLAYQNTEVINNYSYALRKQARLANESLFYLVCEELQRIYDNNTSALQPGNTITIDIPRSQLEALLPDSLHADWDFAKTEIHVGTLSGWTMRYVSSEVPGMESSAFLEQMNSFQTVPIFTKVTLTGTKGTRATSYARSTYAVNAVPLTSYAIFYNQLLESYAGGDFTAAGRVHVNGDFSTSNDASNAVHLYFDRVTASGRHYMDWFHGNTDTKWVAFHTGDFRANGTPRFVGLRNGTFSKNILGDLYTIDRPSTGDRSFGSIQNNSTDSSYQGLVYKSWMDNHISEQDDDWYELAYKNWNGFLKTGAMGVEKVTVPGMDRYEQPSAKPFNPKSTDYWNTAYQMIQPVRESDDASFTSANTAENSKNWTREKNKFAYNAGLVIEVTGSSGNDGYGNVELNPNDPGINVTAYTYERDPQTKAILYNADGTPRKRYVGNPRDLGIVTLEPYAEDINDNTIVTGGLYDNRRQERVHLVKVDVGKIKEVVDNYADLPPTQRFTEDPIGNDLTTGFWNGSVYVQMPYARNNPRLNSGGGPAQDGAQPSVGNYGVYLTNGQELPQQGLTIATNNVVYVAGHYNADGDPTTGNMQVPDDAGEPPAAVAGDAVVLLSANWEPNNSRANSKAKAPTGGTRPAAPTEYSMAIISGNVPTGRSTTTGNSSQSGSIANFLRFLEDWNTSNKWNSSSAGTEAVVRGSIVCMWDSEIAEERWPGHSNVYVRPARLFGYNQLFETSTPPGIPLGGFSGPGYFKEVEAKLWTDELAELN
ncbi:MAG: hypothetical protein Q7P63_07465 [Verrucomicrobiota bacterium JB022]|nr:hypothetical protein [Verrucomicrobiota bacterium JB022]